MLCHCPEGADKPAEPYSALFLLWSSYGSGLHGLDAEQRLVAVKSLYTHMQFKKHYLSWLIPGVSTDSQNKLQEFK